MISASLIAELIKWGGILLGGLALFFHLKNSGRNEQIIKDKTESEKLQKKIDNVKPSAPDDVNDSLRKGDF